MAAAPWDQLRSARLDADFNAPLPAQDLALVLRRLERWSLRGAGRFAAIYVRKSDIGEGFSTQVALDDRTLTVDFQSPERQRLRRRLLGAVVALAALTTFLAVASGAKVWTTRAEAEQRLDALGLSAERSVQQTRELEALAAQARALEGQAVSGARAADVLRDLRWAARARSQDARIDAFHWEPGVFAVEARGEESPFATADRAIERASAPVRTGSWLWGVVAASPAEAGS